MFMPASTFDPCLIIFLCFFFERPFIKMETPIPMPMTNAATTIPTIIPIWEGTSLDESLFKDAANAAHVLDGTVLPCSQQALSP